MKTLILIALLGAPFGLVGCNSETDELMAERTLLLEEKSELKAENEQLSRRIEELLAVLDAQKAKASKMEVIRDLARTAHGKLRDLNIAALDFPTNDTTEIKQAAATALLMRNDAAKEACENLDRAIEEK